MLVAVLTSIGASPAWLSSALRHHRDHAHCTAEPEAELRSLYLATWPANGSAITESDALITRCLVICTSLVLFSPPYPAEVSNKHFRSASLRRVQPGGALPGRPSPGTLVGPAPSLPLPGWSSRTRCFLRQGISSCFCKRKQSLRRDILCCVFL